MKQATSDYLTALNRARQNTETAFDKAIMETGIESMYGNFLSRVAEGRNMTVEKVCPIKTAAVTHLQPSNGPLRLGSSVRTSRW